jgi:hypothetical protein
MNQRTLRGHRGATPLVLVLGGGAVVAATWIGGSHAWAIAATVVYAVLAVIAYVWAGGTGDVAANLRAGGDERQRSVDRDATAITALAMIAVALVGAIVALGRTGDPGPYGVMCAVAGIAYAVSFAVLRWRR